MPIVSMYVTMSLLRELLRAVERHVLDEVREPALVVVLQHRPALTASQSSARFSGSALVRT